MVDRWLARLKLGCFWRRRLKCVAATVCIAGGLTADNTAWPREPAPYWHEAFPELAETACQPSRRPVRLVWQDGNDERPEERDGIQQTLFQSQYPLSKDSEDLLPREDHWNRLKEEQCLDAIEDMPTEDSDAHNVDPNSSQESPWIVWEKTVLTATWIAPNAGGLGITSLDARGSIEFPEFQAVWFAPRVAIHSLNGPTATDLPANLYDVSFETVGMVPIGERWLIQAAIAPSLFTDSQNTSRKAFRLPGRVVAFWKYSDTLTITGGILYLDRDDVKAIPSAGLLWNPTENWKFELAAPRPRIAKRFSHENNVERWGYIVGEFGGGTWAIRRASGVNDVISLQDYRFMFGYEQKRPEHRSWLIEAGYVFSRRLKYTSGIGDMHLPGTALIRLGMTF